MNTAACTVLFIDTGNSARSIMAEAILNHLGKERFRAFSAGIHPTRQIHPLAVGQITRAGLSSEGLYSKGWEEFITPDTPPLDFVIYLCHDAANDSSLAWHSHPMSTLWNIDDPAIAENSEGTRHRAYATAFSQIKWRISTFINLPLSKLEKMALKSELDKIGDLRERRRVIREQ